MEMFEISTSQETIASSFEMPEMLNNMMMKLLEVLYPYNINFVKCEMLFASFADQR